MRDSGSIRNSGPPRESKETVRSGGEIEQFVAKHMGRQGAAKP
jgi:hypothetical protein